MKPIETESNAELFLSWLRQYKPNIITASRNVAVTDFGRLILLNGVTDIFLTCVALTRSGSLKVALFNSQIGSGVVVPAGTFSLNNRSTTDFGSPITFDSRSNGSEVTVPSIIELYYNHNNNTWFVKIEGKDTSSGGNIENGSNRSIDGNTIARRTLSGGLNCNNYFAVYDASKDRAGDNDDNSFGIVHYQNEAGANSVIQSGVNGVFLSINFYHTGNTIMSFSARAQAGDNGGIYTIADVPGVTYANDVAAAAGGVAVGELYETTAKKFRVRMA